MAEPGIPAEARAPFFDGPTPQPDESQTEKITTHFILEKSVLENITVAVTKLLTEMGLIEGRIGNAIRIAANIAISKGLVDARNAKSIGHFIRGQYPGFFGPMAGTIISEALKAPARSSLPSHPPRRLRWSKSSLLLLPSQPPSRKRGPRLLLLDPPAVVLRMPAAVVPDAPKLPRPPRRPRADSGTPPAPVVVPVAPAVVTAAV